MSETTKPICVVGIGASVGGLKPIEEFFDHMPVDNGIAFVVVQHLSPDFKSLMDVYAAMESELIYTKESLIATIEKVETSNETLQSANQQLVAANEELQSTNQELHSVNEELYSVNAESQGKIGALKEMTDDEDNLLGSTDTGVIFLDADKNVRKVTNAASKYIKLLSSDVGRKITDLAMHIHSPKFYEPITKVIETGLSFSKMETTKTGLQILVRVMPYVCSNGINGAIINLIEMSDAPLQGAG